VSDTPAFVDYRTAPQERLPSEQRRHEEAVRMNEGPAAQQQRSVEEAVRSAEREQSQDGSIGFAQGQEDQAADEAHQEPRRRAASVSGAHGHRSAATRKEQSSASEFEITPAALLTTQSAFNEAQRRFIYANLIVSMNKKQQDY